MPEMYKKRDTESVLLKGIEAKKSFNGGSFPVDELEIFYS
jgi:hypothetical protein